MSEKLATLDELVEYGKLFKLFLKEHDETNPLYCYDPIHSSEVLNTIAEEASKNNDIELLKLSKKYGAKDFNNALASAAFNSNIKIAELCIKYGATNYTNALKIVE